MADAPEAMDPSIGERRTGNPGDLPADMARWMATLIRTIDTISLWVGRVVCWLVVPLMLAMVYEVVVRKTLTPTIWAYDISRMLYGAMFMLGAGYALSKGVHIRSDFLYRDWPVKRQGQVDAALYIVLYFPTLFLFLLVSNDYALRAIVGWERSMETAWMPYLGPIKACIPVGVALLLMQGVSELLKSLYAARTGRWPHQT